MSATGLLGGAFDPPHLGHVALAGAALAELALEQLLVVPTGEPAHKRAEAPAAVRYELAAAAFAELPAVELSPLELERPGPSYTVDTVRALAARWPDVVVIVGADELLDFPSWRDPDGILALARLAVASRPGYHEQRVAAVLAELAQPERVSFFTLPAVPVSSSEVRARVRNGEPIDDLVPPAVAGLIDQHRLYHGH